MHLTLEEVSQDMSEEETFSLAQAVRSLEAFKSNVVAYNQIHNNVFEWMPYACTSSRYLRKSVTKCDKRSFLQNVQRANTKNP